MVLHLPAFERPLFDPMNFSAPAQALFQLPLSSFCAFPTFPNSRAHANSSLTLPELISKVFVDYLKQAFDVEVSVTLIECFFRVCSCGAPFGVLSPWQMRSKGST